MCFYGKIGKIIPKLSLLPLHIWSTAYRNVVHVLCYRTILYVQLTQQQSIYKASVLKTNYMLWVILLWDMSWTAVVSDIQELG